MEIALNERLAEAAAAESVRRIDFEEATVRPGFIPCTFFLTVSGTKPYLNMEVELSPRIYVRQPEYWGIEVIGIMPGIGLPATAPFHVTIPLDGVIGTKGIEVIGATSSRKFELEADCGVELGNQLNDATYRANQVIDRVFIMAEGNTPTPGYDVYFERSPLRIFPPEFILKQRRPDGPTPDVITPFFAVTSFTAAKPIETVTVHDAQGRHEIPVDQTPDLTFGRK